MAKKQDKGFRKHRGITAIAVYLVLFAFTLFYFTGTSFSPTGQVILADSLAKQTFDTLLIIIIAFAVILGFVLDFNLGGLIKQK